RVTAYLLYLVKSRLSRTFLRFFEVFSWAEAHENPSKAVVMRISAAFRIALAPDSLTIIPPGKHFVNTFFHFFRHFLFYAFPLQQSDIPTLHRYGYPLQDYEHHYQKLYSNSGAISYTQKQTSQATHTVRCLHYYIKRPGTERTGSFN
ncbi:MAG: hypothetical protein UCO57_07260, partial [Gemmiger sp.]|uniref:hypothetical protein n=1 Tax=Gemmiger sp. TaxID=2049027 RepID=UPI002E78AD62